MALRSRLLSRNALVLLLAAPLAACSGGGDNNTDAGTDVATDHSAPQDGAADVATDQPAPQDGAADTGGDATMGSADCMAYCTEVTTNCTGANAQYDDLADCVAYCGAAGWSAGSPGDMAGDTLACRIYHGGTPAMGDPGTHCVHAGPTGAGVCGTVNFRADMPSTYTRVDRMGMPAVSTALVPSAQKNAYNDANPSGDMTFAAAFITSLTGLHSALDPDLNTLHLTPCSMTTLVGGLPECLGQSYAAGHTVASLVVPFDTVTLDVSRPAGFPNGRRLEDPVIDVTLAALLLKLNGGICGTGTTPCAATTLAMLPLNPAHNDATNLTTFPYLAPPHTM